MIHIRSGSPYEEQIGFSRAIRTGERVVVSGTAPIPAPGHELSESPYDQMMRCGQIIATALAQAGATLADVIRTRMFLVDAGDAAEVGRAHRELFGEARPAATMIVVSALLDPRWRVEVEAEAVIAPVPSPAG
jgi:enamine deaminase RidA (YjgF/YER057c/UK114 family)